MAVNLSPVGGVAAQFFTNNGVPLAGGKLYTYAAGTTTPAATYTASNGSFAWTNPIVLDAGGRVPSSGEIWLTDGLQYKFLLKDSNDVLIATYDNVSGINSNFVAFVNQQEIVTATAGQTVFNLGINYQPGTNSLSVFVDGVNQYGPGALYAYTETDSNTVTFNTGLHVGAEVKFVTSQLQNASVGDASQVTYDPPFTGSAVTNVEAKLSEYLSLADFGADPTGATDSTAAVQAFFNQAQAAGGDCIIPKGTYRVSSPILIYDTGAQRHDGARIRGSGINETIIDFRGSGRIFDIRGIPASNGSGTQSGTYFIWGLELSGMTLDGTNKTGSTDAIRLVGVWNSIFDNLTIKNVRHGIVSDGDVTYNPNPDFSSTSNCKVNRCNFERLTSFGFYNSVAQAAPGWEFNQSVFVFCGDGGIRMASGGIAITECAFSGCGWSSELATPNVNGTGILFSGSTTATCQITVENCEFDTNFTSHVDMEFAGGIRFSGNRYIFNDRYGYGSVCPTGGAIRIAWFGAGNAIQNCLFTNEVYRLDPGPTTGTPICFNFANNANVQNIRAVGGTFVDNNGTLNFTKVTGQTTSNSWVRNNYQLELSDISDLTQIVPGRPFAEYIGTISGTPSTVGGNVLTVLPFNTQEGVNSQIFGTSLYNTSTGVFTCPVAGYYDIDFLVSLVSTISTDYNAFRIYKNGSFVNEWGGAGGGGTRTWYQGRYRLFCNASDTLDIREVCSVSRVITGAYSFLRISLSR